MARMAGRSLGTVLNTRAAGAAAFGAGVTGAVSKSPFVRDWLLFSGIVIFLIAFLFRR